MARLDGLNIDELLEGIRKVEAITRNRDAQLFGSGTDSTQPVGPGSQHALGKSLPRWDAEPDFESEWNGDECRSPMVFEEASQRYKRYMPRQSRIVKEPSPRQEETWDLEKDRGRRRTYGGDEGMSSAEKYDRRSWRDSILEFEEEPQDWLYQESQHPTNQQEAWDDERVHAYNLGQEHSRRRSLGHHTYSSQMQHHCSSFDYRSSLPEEPPPPYSPPRRYSSIGISRPEKLTYPLQVNGFNHLPSTRSSKPKRQIRAKEYEQQLRWLAGRRSLGHR